MHIYIISMRSVYL